MIKHFLQFIVKLTCGLFLKLEKLRGASPKLLDQTTFDFAKPEDHLHDVEDGNHHYDHPPQNHPEEGIRFMGKASFLFFVCLEIEVMTVEHFFPKKHNFCLTLLPLL